MSTGKYTPHVYRIIKRDGSEAFVTAREFLSGADADEICGKLEAIDALLAACEAFLGEYEEYRHDDMRIAFVPKYDGLLRAEIKKAKGEA